MKRAAIMTMMIAIAAAGILAAAFGVRGEPPAPPKAAVPHQVADKYDSPQIFMEGIYAADRGPQPAAAEAAVVPHHLVAAESIALGVKAIAARKPSAIIMVSPDHFGRCPTVLCTAYVEYATPLGGVSADADAVKALSSSPLVTLAPDLFDGEHGIYAVAPFVARYLPGTKVTPIVISSAHSWKSRKDEIAGLLESILGPDDALVISSDFSHYLTLEEADKMDESTSKALLTGDLDALENLKQPDQSDCPACLWAAAAVAASRHWQAPGILMHTNSATLLGDPSAESTTSHFTVVWGR